MPRYDYDCAACGRRSELIHGVHDDSPTACPMCGGGPLKKAFAPPTIHFKGSGWAKKERHAVASAGSSRSSEPTERGDAASGGGDGSKDAATPAAATADSTATTTAASDGGTSSAGKADGERRPAKAAAAGTASSD